MANLVRKAFSTLLDKLSSPAQVVAVRAWAPRTMYELDLHLPTVEMAKWTTIPRLKCQVAAGTFEFRDYTPATWDVARRTCTLYIEAGHPGAGSRWVEQVRPGDRLVVGPAHAEQLPETPGRVLALGDGSALGHLLALKQLTSQVNNPVAMCVALPADYSVPAILRLAHPELEILCTDNVRATLEQCLQTRPLSNYTAIYVAGNMDLVAQLRRHLKAQPELRARLYVKGFWK